MIILSYYPSYKLSNHDSSVSIVKDGELIYSYEEEKISRIHRRESKYFPDRAIMSALYTTSIEPNEIDMVCICLITQTLTGSILIIYQSVLNA